MSSAECGWCKGKADQIRATIKELKETLPLAGKLQEKIVNLEKTNLKRPLDEIRSVKDKLVQPIAPREETRRPEPFTGRLSPRIFDGGIKVSPTKLFGRGGRLFNRS